VSQPRKIVAVSIAPRYIPLGQDTVNVHRFDKTIGGRAYQIEVTRASNRWRAQLRPQPGGGTAMMPFYGATPDEAASHLTEWLTLNHRRRISPAPVGRQVEPQRSAGR
jgi:hypothetical protein